MILHLRSHFFCYKEDVFKGGQGWKQTHQNAVVSK